MSSITMNLDRICAGLDKALKNGNIINDSFSDMIEEDSRGSGFDCRGYPAAFSLVFNSIAEMLELIEITTEQIITSLGENEK